MWNARNEHQQCNNYMYMCTACIPTIRKKNISTPITIITNPGTKKDHPLQKETQYFKITKISTD